MLGWIRAEQADPAGAAEAFQRALAHTEEWQGMDNSDHVRKQLARSLLQLGQPVQARAELQKIENPAEDPETCWLSTRCDLQQGTSTDSVVAALAVSYRESNPTEAEPAPFVGEVRCVKCHEDVAGAQHQSRHARTFLHKEQFASLPFPDRPIVDPGNPQVTHTFSKGDDRVEVRTKVNNQVYETVVDYVFGSGDRGLTMVGHDQSERPFEYRLSYYSDLGGWDLTSGQPPLVNQPSYYQGTRIVADAVRRCLVCHTTHSHAILTRSGPESFDKAIGCERCHGPGSNHLKSVAAKTVDLAIGRPKLATGPRIVELCGQCHSPRDKALTLSPGSPDSVRFQGTTFAWSRCYVESGNKLDCVTCHDPHRNARTSSAWYEARCLKCHSAAESPPRPQVHPPVALSLQLERPVPSSPRTTVSSATCPRSRPLWLTPSSRTISSASTVNPISSADPTIAQCHDGSTVSLLKERGFTVSSHQVDPTPEKPAEPTTPPPELTSTLENGQSWLGPARRLAALAGLLAGLLAFAVGEATYKLVPAERVKQNVLMTNQQVVEPTQETLNAAAVKNGAIAFAVLGLCLAGFLGLAGGLARRSPPAALKGGLLGAVVGTALGAGLSLVLLPLSLQAQADYPDYDIIISLAIRGLIWGLLGAAAGLAFTIGLGQRRLLGRTLTAGFMGAAVGAIAFELIGAAFFASAKTVGPVSETLPTRLLACLLVTLGATITLALLLPKPLRAFPATLSRAEHDTES